MTDKELRRLSKLDLIELLISQKEENEKLKLELAETKRQLDNRLIHVEESGSLAEAALKINGVFEAAQRAADQYLENIKARASGDDAP